MSLVTSHKICITSYDLSMFTSSSVSIFKIFATANRLTVCPRCIPFFLCLTAQWPDFEVTLTLGKALQLSQTYNIHPRSTILFYLEAVFEPLGHKVEDYGIDAGVDGCHVDAEVVKHKQKTASTEEGQTVVNKKKRFKRRRRLNQYHCHVWQDKQNTVDDVSAVSFSQRQKNLKVHLEGSPS